MCEAWEWDQSRGGNEVDKMADITRTPCRDSVSANHNVHQRKRKRDTSQHLAKATWEVNFYIWKGKSCKNSPCWKIIVLMIMDWTFDGIVTGFCKRCKVGLLLTIIVSSDKRIVKITQTKRGIGAAGILSFASIRRFIVCRNFLDTLWLIRFGIIYVFVTININLNKNDEILIAGFVSINHLRHCWLIWTKRPE